jgi:CheY-like chemotaxis protein
MVTTLLPNLTDLEVGGCDTFNRRQLTSRATAVRNGESGSSSRRPSPAARLLRVLIVDDDRDTCESLGWLVRLWGHAGRQAHGGAAALRAAAAEPPDVILLDVEMPVVHGFAVARQLRVENPSRQPLIIAITGRADEARREQCREAAIDVVLLKPVDPEVLETLLMLECSHKATRPIDITTNTHFKERQE